MCDIRTLSTVTAVAALLALHPGAAAAQSSVPTVDLSVRGGVSMPTGDLAEITDVGPAAGADVAFWINDRIAVSVDASVDMLRGDDRSDLLPDIQLWHYGGGLQARLIPPSSPVSIKLLGGAGATGFRTNHFEPAGPGARDRISETYFALNGGAEVGYEMTDQIDLSLRGGAFFTFTDETDLSPLSEMSPEVDAFDSVMTLPITLQVDIALAE